MKKIFVACGSGVATSQTVASKIGNMIEDEGLDASVEAVDIKSLESIIDQCYNESYGLGKDGIRREKAGRYENQGVRTIFGARRVP